MLAWVLVTIIVAVLVLAWPGISITVAKVRKEAKNKREKLGTKEAARTHSGQNRMLRPQSCSLGQ
jgi:hypothetical protein